METIRDIIKTELIDPILLKQHPSLHKLAMELLTTDNHDVVSRSGPHTMWDSLQSRCLFWFLDQKQPLRKELNDGIVKAHLYHNGISYVFFGVVPIHIVSSSENIIPHFQGFPSLIWMQVRTEEELEDFVIVLKAVIRANNGELAYWFTQAYEASMPGNNFNNAADAQEALTRTLQHTTWSEVGLSRERRIFSGCKRLTILILCIYFAGFILQTRS